MDIRLYNTLSRQTDLLAPLDPDNVRIYVCGPTVYDRAHIGNARPVVVFDTLFRLLRHVYGPDHVTYVRNITDVDDKINARAAESGRSIAEITEETTGWYHEDMAAVGALPPTHEPRATAYIDEMIAMIEVLIARGHAYVADGHVLFDVKSYPAYGALSRRSLDDMVAGARVEVAPYKRDPMDFVLWKPAGQGPGWESPWGQGRPGWHIECSAMAKALLGPRFDIHGGGIDLQFPHHENEVAQSCCANADDRMASIWMHNGFLQVEGEKMSKSLGNFFTVRDLLDQGIPGVVLRFVLLSTHYAKPIDWTAEKARTAHEKLLGWSRLVEGAEAGAPAEEAVAALADDLNTPLVLGKILSDLAKDDSPEGRARFAGTLGLVGLDLSGLAARDTRLAALEERILKARQDKDYAASDHLRDGLTAAGYRVQIGKDSVEITAGPEADAAKLDEL
ncbi:cysteine--tRNA ligase [Paracoccaceae bacterium GXU_MW_L88]